MGATESFRTVKREAESRFEEKKSVFISRAKPCGEWDEAEEFFRSVRKEFPDATHHVTAFINRGGNVVRFDDDGEPKGTAGMPALEVLKKEELRGVAVIVTRYFGGTLLGAGGLARAYARGARDAVAQAGICTFEKLLCLKLGVDYSALAKVEYELRRRNIRILEKDFADGVEFRLLCSERGQKEIDEFLLDFSGGKIRTEFLEFRFAENTEF